jgi:hypothetical protein
MGAMEVGKRVAVLAVAEEWVAMGEVTPEAPVASEAAG